MNSVTRYPSSIPAVSAAFTLVDLVVLLGVLAAGLALLTPALARTQPNSKVFQCLNNHRQLSRAWRMYADDNNDRVCGSRNWLVSDGGWFGYPPGPDSVNIAFLTNGVLNTYLGRNYMVYKCPGDPTTYNGKPVVRSVSMQCYIGTDGSGNNAWDSNYLNFPKISSMTRPGPANTLLMLDQSAYTIDDDFFAIDMSGYDPDMPASLAFVEAPAAYHNKAGGLSFADGHAEIHKWRDSRTPTAQLFQASPNNLDVAWIQDHATRKVVGATR